MLCLFARRDIHHLFYISVNLLLPQQRLHMIRMSILSWIGMDSPSAICVQQTLDGSYLAAVSFAQAMPRIFTQCRGCRQEPSLQSKRPLQQQSMDTILTVATVQQEIPGNIPKHFPCPASKWAICRFCCAFTSPRLRPFLLSVVCAKYLVHTHLTVARFCLSRFF